MQDLNFLLPEPLGCFVHFQSPTDLVLKQLKGHLKDLNQKYYGFVFSKTEAY